MSSCTARSCPSTTCSTSAPRARTGRGVRRAGVRDRQAQQPLRLRCRGERPARLRARLRVRPAERLRRRDRTQPARRHRVRAVSSRGSSSRCCSRPDSTPTRSRCCRRRRTFACWSSATGRSRPQTLEAKAVIGGQLVQSRDAVIETREQMRVLSAREPSEQEWQDMLFAWRVCRHVRSNAIVIARRRRDDRDRRGSDEPGGRGPHRGREGAGPSSPTCSPAPRSPPTPSSRSPTAPQLALDAGRQRDHPAGRLGARRGGRCRSRRRGRRDGRDGPPPLPPLAGPRQGPLRPPQGGLEIFAITIYRDPT